MEALIKSITAKTGISPDQASTAVQTVVTFLKDKMPGGIGNQVESFIQGGEKGSFGGVADKMGDMFRK